MRYCFLIFLIATTTHSALAESKPSQAMYLINRWQYSNNVCLGLNNPSYCINRDKLGLELKALGYCYEEEILHTLHLWAPCYNKNN
jgi:hypothetical protein